MNAPESPPPTIEAWCRAWIESSDLATKLTPAAPPDPSRATSWEVDPRPVRLSAPGRPRELELTDRSPRTPRGRALLRPEVRAQLVHTFLHHELQAAELFAWAVLAFPATPRAFRAGLVRLCLSELEHLALYENHLRRLGSRVGAFPVRDWFWERVRSCRTPAAFVALLGLGLEGANLEHSARFAAAFRDAGDEEGARILERVEEEEVAHVAFAVRWFERLAGEPLTFRSWERSLPPPITPAVLRGRPINRDARARAGLDAAFLAQLETVPPPDGSTEERAR